MDLLRSRLVVIVSDDDAISFLLRRTVLSIGANVVASREFAMADLESTARILAAVVVDLRSPEMAWQVVELLRKSPETESTPILLRYDGRHARTAELLLSLNSVHGIESEEGPAAVCEALYDLLDGIANGSEESGTHAWPGHLAQQLASASKAV